MLCLLTTSCYIDTSLQPSQSKLHQYLVPTQYHHWTSEMVSVSLRFKTMLCLPWFKSTGPKVFFFFFPIPFSIVCKQTLVVGWWKILTRDSSNFWCVCVYEKKIKRPHLSFCSKRFITLPSTLTIHEWK